MSAEPIVQLQSLLADHYVLERELGRGSMGVVYLARDIRLDRPVAIKILPRAHSTNPERRERFLREARTSAQLSHPNIVPIYQADEIDGLAFFTMGYVEGENLAERLLARGPFAASGAVRILREAAWALAYAHARGVVHRDVKPENIMIERGSNRAIVTDFGIARNQLASSLTQDGMVLGSAHYMSPEQAAGDKLDGRSDLYSLGVVGYQLLSGRLPFEAEEAATIMAQHVTRPAPSLASLAPHLPRALVAVIDKSLRKAPAERFETGEEFAEALELAMQSVAVSAQGVGAAVVSTDQAQAIWLRAAQLQADASTRLQERYRQPEAAVGPLPSGGYRLHDVEQAAAEAGIGAEFVAMALAEQPTGVADVNAGLSARGDKRLTRMLGTPERSLTASRVIQASPKDVLEAIGRTFTAPAYALSLRDTAGGHPLDGGIMVFRVPMLRDFQAYLRPSAVFSQRLTQLEIESLRVVLKPVGSTAHACEVTISGDLRRGLRKAWTIDKWMSGAAGLAGVSAGTAAGIIPLGVLAFIPAAVGAVALGGLTLGLVRVGYRFALRKGQEQLNNLLEAVEGDLHTASVFGGLPEATPASHQLKPGSGDPNSLLGGN